MKCLVNGSQRCFATGRLGLSGRRQVHRLYKGRNHGKPIVMAYSPAEEQQLDEDMQDLGDFWTPIPSSRNGHKNGHINGHSSMKNHAFELQYAQQKTQTFKTPEFTVMGKSAYKRVLLKLSGEALAGAEGHGVNPDVLQSVAEEVEYITKTCAVEVAIVVGGGNYFRGAEAWDGLDRAAADYVGMLATVMNALQLQGALERRNVPTRVQTAIEMREIAEPYIRRRAIRHLEKGRVVIFGAGTGNPFFTTDTAAALRAAEIGAEAFLKATKVDGVYDCDPSKNKDAKKFDFLSFREVQLRNLCVMDETAITLCKDNNIQVVVFNINQKHNIVKACQGDNIGTKVDHQNQRDQVMMEGQFED